jgi:hypothetical protein
MMEAVSTSETSVNSFETTGLNIPEAAISILTAAETSNMIEFE